MPKLSVADHLEAVINSPNFANFCDGQYPLKDNGCRHYCAIYTLRIKLGAL